MSSLETFETDTEALEAGTVSQHADLGSSSRDLRSKIPHNRVPAVGNETPVMVLRLKDAEVQHLLDQQRDDPGRPESMVVLTLDYWDQPTEKTFTFRGYEVDPDTLHPFHDSKFQSPMKPDYIYVVVKVDVPLLVEEPNGVQREVVLQDEPIKIPITADFRGFVRGFHVLCSQTKLRDCLWEKMLSIEVQQEGGPMHHVCESFAYKPDYIYVVVKVDVPLLVEEPSGVVLQDEPIKIPIAADFRGFVRGFHVLCSPTELRDCLWEKMLSIEVQQEGGPVHHVCESFAYKLPCHEETQPAGSHGHSARSTVTAFEESARGEEHRTEEQG